MTSDELRLMHDTRLSREARLIGLHVASHGDGDHEIAHDELRILLGRGPRDGMAKDDSIAGYVQELVLHGWAQRSPGGRGSPIYSFLPPSQGGSGKVYPPAQGGPEIDVSPPLRGGESSTPHPGGTGDPFYPPPRGDLSAPSSSTSSSAAASTPGRARAREAGSELHPDAERALDERSDLLHGCRTMMHDYLAARVAIEHQPGYAWRVVTALEGGDEWMWRDRTGQALHEGRAKIMGAAFGELLACSEVGDHFRRKPGDFGNLRSTVRYLVASALGVDSDAKKAIGADGPARPAKRTPSSRKVHVEG